MSGSDRPVNVRRFGEIAKGDADPMMVDASTRYQQKLHPGVLCAVHPDNPFDFSEKRPIGRSATRL